MRETKNQKAWKEIDKHLNLIEKIEEQGIYKISSTEIKDISNREPRLMAKFDHSENRPEIFKENDISILPVARKDYVLLKFNSYCEVKYSDKNRMIDSSIIDDYETIDLKSITSEDNAIVISDISKMLSEFLDDEIKFTARGKFGTDDFKFKVKTFDRDREITVSKTGAELDAGFEGDQFYIVEAKIGKVNDFNIRQLYYPYRHWMSRINKNVIPVFFSYSDGVFSFWKFEFVEYDNFNSIVLLSRANFLFQEEIQPIPDEILDIKDFLPIDPASIPFPQADDFEKVINIMELVKSDVNSKEDFADYFSFDPRQADYYYNAAKYLELVTKEKGIVCLTELGEELVKLPRSKRHEGLIRQIFKHKVFYDSFNALKSGDESIEAITEIMRKNSVLNGGTESTLRRRASTILSWCRWIEEKIEESKRV
ncbi:MAG: hypothetical protein U5O15_08335 [Candidatus Krumholzibacteriota bacterium]|nr:hypothetical protein [Candidatus Krumholzibacteriota bacterium]